MNWQRYQIILIGRRNIIGEIRCQTCWRCTKPKGMNGLNSFLGKPPRRRPGRILLFTVPGVNAWAREKLTRLRVVSPGMAAAMSSIFVLAFAVHAQTKITIDHNTGAAINPEFKFKSVPAPSKDDAAAKARVLIVDGEADVNGA